MSNPGDFNDYRFTAQEIDSLSNLLLSQADEQEKKQQEAVGLSHASNPGNIGAPSQSRPVGSKPPQFAKKPKPPSKYQIWTEEELDKQPYFEPIDERIEPQYDILFKQSVGAEDVFFGLSGKVPSIDSCDSILLKISLPGENVKEISTELAPRLFTLRSPKFKLTVGLPRVVKDKEGRAEWDPKKSLLSVTVPIDTRQSFEDGIPNEQENEDEKYTVQ
ncbi:putative PIH1D3 like protein [Blattamonas nauphoetae]|uniref:PIH1D3 like protein n=1 Tax=Blattamonas nauphoetae TaxID=2049346 RepID=A0ABQ9XT87_9EUKA|nr:putative PIH1D3 like protein [Blattamonas nauphoetae]